MTTSDRRTTSTNCLRFTCVYGDNPVVKMDYFPSKAVVDLGPFFGETFRSRDYLLGCPDYARVEKLNGGVRYRFTPIEFGESTLGNYAPQQITAFLRRHSDGDDIQSESFLRRIERFDDIYREVVVSTNPTYQSSSINMNYYFRAINFKVEDLKALLLRIIPSDLRSESMKKHSWASFRGTVFKEDDKANSSGFPVKAEQDVWNKREVIGRIRDALLGLRHPIVLLNHYGPDSGLDDISLLRTYKEIGTTGLRVVREK